MIIPVNPSNIVFGYKSVLKTEFKNGNLKGVKYDPMGNLLTNKNVTLDHFIPKSKGGKSAVENYILMVDKNNWAKGNKPANEFMTMEGLKKYLAQFIDVKTLDFDGNEYIKSISNKAKRIFKNW